MPIGILNGTAGNDLIRNGYTDPDGETTDDIYMPNGPDAPWAAVVWDAGAGNDTILGHYYVSVRGGPRVAYLDCVKFQGSRSSRRLCGWPLASAVRVALR